MQKGIIRNYSSLLIALSFIIIVSCSFTHPVYASSIKTDVKQAFQPIKENVLFTYKVEQNGKDQTLTRKEPISIVVAMILGVLWAGGSALAITGVLNSLFTGR